MEFSENRVIKVDLLSLLYFTMMLLKSLSELLFEPFVLLCLHVEFYELLHNFHIKFSVLLLVCPIKYGGDIMWQHM